MNTATVTTENYTEGRPGPPRVVVLHTTQSPCIPGGALAVANFLARPSTVASAHYVVDCGTVVTQVPEQHTAWAAPGANGDGIQIEQTGYAEWTADDWAAPLVVTMLGNVATVIASVCRRWDIPARHLTDAELQAGQRGLVGHDQVSRVYKRSNHWDPGPSYPWATVLPLVGQLLQPTPPPPPTSEDDDMLLQIISDPAQGGDGTVYVLDGVEAWALREDVTRVALEAVGSLKPGAKLVHPNTVDRYVYRGILEDNIGSLRTGPS